MANRVKRHAGHWGRALLDALLPPQCLTCDAPVIEAGRFCAACFNATDFITEPCCHRCGAPFAFALEGGTSRLCPQCRFEPPPWRQARAAFRYDEHSRRAILPLKYNDRTELAAALAAMMARAGAALLAEADLLIPVPLHPGRLRHRRYNQAVLIARALSQASGVKLLPNALLRTRSTRSLADLSAEARATVVDGAFALRPRARPLIQGQHVLLIDDVLTSGATAGACTRALLSAGAAEVDVLVAARVPDPRQP